MAKNGQINTQTLYDSYFWVYWSESEQSISDNKTKIYWSCGVTCGHSFYSNAIKMSAVTINGTQVYSGGTYSNFAKGEHRIAYGYLDIDHNADGKKTFSISPFTGWLYSGYNYSSNGGSFELAAIPRISKPSLSVSEIEFGKKITIYTNRKSSSFKHKIFCKYDSYGWRAITPTPSVDTEYEWIVPTNLMNEIPNDKKLSIAIGCDTYYNGSYIGEDYVSFTANVPTSTKPTVKMEVALKNDSLPSKFGGLCIQGKSRLSISLNGEGQYNATIPKCYTVVEGKTYYSSSFITDVIKTPSNFNVVGTVVDSRGFSNSKTQPITVIPYSKPLVVPIGSNNAILCYRSDGNGERIGNSTSVWIKAKRTYYSLSGENQCALQWRSKLTTEEWNDSAHPWNNLIGKSDTATNEYNALIPGVEFNLRKSYSVQIRAIDDIGEYDIKSFEIPTEDVALHLGKGGKNVSVGSYCDYSEDYTFHSEWKAIFDNGIVIGEDRYPLADFVIEQGTDGIWTYRKWASGIAECRGIYVQNNVDIKTSWGVSLFESTGYVVDLPSGLFVDTPQFDITLVGSGGVSLEVYSLGSTSQTPRMCAVRPEGTTTVSILNTSITAYGRWK